MNILICSSIFSEKLHRSAWAPVQKEELALAIESARLFRQKMGKLEQLLEDISISFHPKTPGLKEESLRMLVNITLRHPFEFEGKIDAFEFGFPALEGHNRGILFRTNSSARWISDKLAVEVKKVLEAHADAFKRFEQIAQNVRAELKVQS